jgi:hypothetical protein
LTLYKTYSIVMVVNLALLRKVTTMIAETAKIGDKVAITIPAENREWGYNPCPDGTKATVVGFTEIIYGRIGNYGHKPGVYANHSTAKLLLEDGTEMMEPCDRLTLLNEADYQARVAAFRQAQKANPNHWRATVEAAYIHDLPETPFWEGDIIAPKAHTSLLTICDEMPSAKYLNTFMIVGIEYYNLDRVIEGGYMYPAYQVSSSLGAGWQTSATANHMRLIERGNVWKFYHDEELSFSDLHEEMRFYEAIGQVDEVRNPANGLYKWTTEEVVDAIRNGLAHGISVDSGLLGMKPHVSACRFRTPRCLRDPERLYTYHLIYRFQ